MTATNYIGMILEVKISALIRANICQVILIFLFTFLNYPLTILFNTPAPSTRSRAHAHTLYSTK